MKLTIIRGLPGSGKSTMAKDIGCFHVEADMFHLVNGKYQFKPENKGYAHRWCKSAVSFGLSNGMDVVVSNTFTTKDEIEPYLVCAKESGADIEIIRMTANYGNIHNVPTIVLEQMKERFEDVDGEQIYT